MEENNKQEREYSVGEFAKLTSVTERTLRFYDRKGLLKPTAYNVQGHRLYTQQDLPRLQKILTYKFLGFSLDKIEKLLNNPDESLTSTLASQSQLLKQKKKKLEQMIATVDHLLNLVPDDHNYSNDLLLALIHSIQHEEDQKKWLSKRLPAEWVDSLFWDSSSPKNLFYERKCTSLLGDLMNLRRDGCKPDDPQAVGKAKELLQIFAEILPDGAMQELVLQTGEQSEDGFDGQLDPFLFHSGFPPEEEHFLSAVVEQAIDQLEKDGQLHKLIGFGTPKQSI